MLGKTIELSLHTLKLLLQKSLLKGGGGREGGSFLGTKMRPRLAAEMCVSQNTSWMHRMDSGGREA